MKWHIGIDEVGRGPLAGPVMVGVFAIRSKSIDLLDHSDIQDSKSLSKARKERALRYIDDINTDDTIRYAVVSESQQYIDRYGIVRAIHKCIERGLEVLEIPAHESHIYLDGGLRAPAMYQNQSTHIKGDRDVPVISTASILAKMTRDEYMTKLLQKHPEYGWERNMGYGTREHRKAIEQYGLTKHHRQSYCKML